METRVVPILDIRLTKSRQNRSQHGLAWQGMLPEFLNYGIATCNKESACPNSTRGSLEHEVHS